MEPAGQNAYAIDIKRDVHVHTRYCNHAKGEMVDYVEAAIERGLREICFLGHHEQNVPYYRKNWMTIEELGSYFREGRMLQDKFQDRISVLVGLELGINPPFLKELGDAVKSHPWDLVGLSYHYLDWEPQFINVCSPRKECLTAFDRYDRNRAVHDYFEKIEKALEVLDVDFLCHFDVIKRNHPEIRYDGRTVETIDRILRKVVARDLMIEVNTSGFEHRDEQYPEDGLLSKIIAMNIQLVVGSDSHHPSEVGRHFERIPSVIGACRARLSGHCTGDGESARAC